MERLILVHPEGIPSSTTYTFSNNIIIEEHEAQKSNDKEAFQITTISHWLWTATKLASNNEHSLESTVYVHTLMQNT